MSRARGPIAPGLRTAGIAAVLIGLGGGVLAFHRRTCRTATAIGIIGGADGPTHIHTTRRRKSAGPAGQRRAHRKTAAHPPHIPEGAAAIGFIGGTDGPTAIFTTSRNKRRRKVRIFHGGDGPTAVCYLPPSGHHQWPPKEAGIIGGDEVETVIHTRAGFNPGHLPVLFLAAGALLLTLHKYLRERAD